MKEPMPRYSSRTSAELRIPAVATTQAKDYFRCPWYIEHNLEGLLFSDAPMGPLCKLEKSAQAQCEEGNLLTCIYKDHPKIQEIMKEKKEELMKAEEKIRKLLIEITNAFGEPYR